MVTLTLESVLGLTGILSYFLAHRWCAYAIPIALSVVCVVSSNLSMADMKKIIQCKYFSYAWFVLLDIGDAPYNSYNIMPPKAYFHIFSSLKLPTGGTLY